MVEDKNNHTYDDIINLPNPTSMILEDNIGKLYDITTCLEKFMEIFSGNVTIFLENNDNQDQLIDYIEYLNDLPIDDGK